MRLSSAGLRATAGRQGFVFSCYRLEAKLPAKSRDGRTGMLAKRPRLAVRMAKARRNAVVVTKQGAFQ
jgi:hypothetical protein